MGSDNTTTPTDSYVLVLYVKVEIAEIRAVIKVTLVSSDQSDSFIEYFYHWRAPSTNRKYSVSSTYYVLVVTK